MKVCLDCQPHKQIQTTFMQRNEKDRPVVTHTGNNLEGLFLNQPSRFHEQKVSSFGKPLLHHALVKNKPAAYASRD